MRQKLKGTEAVGHLFDIITFSMGPIIHRINMPLVSCAVVAFMEDAVHNWIPHKHIARTHVDFSSQDVAPLWA